MLGDVTSLSGVNFNQTLYLGINIESDGEMTPRKKLGAVPSAYRLYDQSQTGTFEMDLAAAMDIVNIVGSVVGIGQISAGARFVRVGKGLMVLGLGADGLGIAIAGAQFVDAASKDYGLRGLSCFRT